MKGWFVLIMGFVTYWPTATQVQLVRQAAAFKAAGFEPGPFGEETMDHDEPFQESASVDRLVRVPDSAHSAAGCLAGTGNAAQRILGARRRVGARRDGELLSVPRLDEGR